MGRKLGNFRNKYLKTKKNLICEVNMHARQKIYKLGRNWLSSFGDTQG